MPETPAAPPHADWPRVERALREALRDLRFGSLEIVVHDARVVQIERRERTRFADSREPT